jgi:alcohol dehydrogenase class IV
MSMNWNYPTTIWFGDQRINEIQKACESLNIQKPLIVTDPEISLVMFNQIQLEIMLNLEFLILIQMLMME